MLRKSLLLAVCLCFFVTPMAMADNDPVRQEPELYWGQRTQIEAQKTLPTRTSGTRAYQEEGTCHTERNGQGYVINWADTRSKCRNGGSSWVSTSGDITNYERGK